MTELRPGKRRGPRTAAGKARSRLNALRHGLAAVPTRQPAGAFAQALHAAIPAAADGDLAQLACVLEGYQSELRQARQAAARAAAAVHDHLGGPMDSLVAQLEQCRKLVRYDRRALSRRKFALRALDVALMAGSMQDGQADSG